MLSNTHHSLFDSGESLIFRVGEITRDIKAVLEDAFADVWIEGEISNFKRHTSGHCYFTLKDSDAQIRCVMWRGMTQYLRFPPSNGMLVHARGDVTVYEARGDYQLVVKNMRAAGEGALQRAFEVLKRKLEKEGLFEAARKKTLPRFPERIGIVTSRSGAAIEDMLSVIARRYPQVEVFLCPVQVQGAGAASDISEAIRTFNDQWKASGNPRFRVDVLLVGRGGGSAEDLWAFNEEEVARAVFESRIPIISAVGHETDFSIADFVADRRAATPSMAAELAVPDRCELEMYVRSLELTCRRSVLNGIDQRRGRVQHLLNCHALNRPVDRLRQQFQRLDELIVRQGRAICRLLEQKRSLTDALRQRLESLSPRRYLKRGFAWVDRNGTLIRNAADLVEGDLLRLHFHDGIRRVQVKDGNGET